MQVLHKFLALEQESLEQCEQTIKTVGNFPKNYTITDKFDDNFIVDFKLVEICNFI